MTKSRGLRVRRKIPAEIRFWPKLLIGDGCWPYQGFCVPLGYGQFWDGERVVGAHEFAYRLLVGPISKGLEIDHLCRNPSCCRPDHLELVTHAENVRRGIGAGWQLNAAKTHCKRGHPFNMENTYRYKDGRRDCAICRRTMNRERYQRAH